MRKQILATTESRDKDKVLVDYSGKTIYVGIDVHKNSWQVAALYDGMLLGNHSFPARVEALIDFFGKRYPGADLRCVYESCSWGFNIQRSLSAADIDCIVVHAGDVPGSDKEKKNKTDKRDAARLARHHAAGLLTAIHVPDPILQKERNLIRFRKRLSGDLNRSKNRIKSLLKFEGIEIPAKYDTSKWSKNFISWLEQLGEQDQILDVTLEFMLEQVKAQRKILLQVEKGLRDLMRQEKYSSQSSILLTIPGVGPLTAALIMLEIGDVRRFKTFDNLNCFVGFYPGSHSSGERDMKTRITSRRHNQLRSMLIEAAWVAVRRDPAMLDTYQGLTKRMKGNEAIIRIARKLLRRIRAVLLTSQPYETGIVK